MNKVYSISTLFLAISLTFACASDKKGNATEETESKQTQSTDVVNPEEINNPITATQPAEQTINTSELPILTFEKDIYEFPQTIIEGERVRHSFKFKNTGQSDLLIVDANAPCGCTIPSFSKEPIKPGGEGKIDVEFNSDGKPGRNEKAVIVTTNAIPNTKELRFVINVTPKAN